MDTFIISFIMMEFFMFIATIPLLLKINYYFQTKKAAKRFKSLVVIFCIYLLVDAVWALLVYGNLKKSIYLLHILSIVDFLCLGLMPYLWFLYVEEILNAKYFKTRFPRYINIIIEGLFIFIVITNFKTKYIYRINKEGYMIWGENTGKIVIFLIVLFLGSATIRGILSLISLKNKNLIKKSLMVIVFIIPIAIGIYLYYYYRLAICIPPAIFTSISLYFLCQEDQRKYIDNLTGVFNRKKLKILAEEKKDLNKIYYIDIDKFKSINDTYGHFEGDKVLKIVSSAFKNINEKYDSVTVRIGGDEFIIVVCKENIKDINFKKIIREEIEKIEKEEGLPYKINVSIGKTSYDSNSQSLEVCLKEADIDMYKNKERKK